MSKQPINITASAADQIREIMQKKGIPKDYSLRIGVRGGAGCFGVNYIIGFDKKKEIDNSYSIDQIPVLIEKRQLMFILGVTLDYISDDEQQGFTFYKESEAQKDPA